jgi:glycosyltransferase involved in cell wall biosynthesis
MAMKISAFTFAFNALDGGMPIIQAIEAIRPYVDEVVAVDCQSTDDTRRVLQAICHKVIDGPVWEGRDIQHQVFELHRQCTGDIIILFEADEVYSESLLSEIHWAIEKGQIDIGVYRIQIEQNFQRIRSYPEPVYRVFPKGGGNYQNHPTQCLSNTYVLPPSAGYLWDCSNCFRDNFYQRQANQAIVWGSSHTHAVARHFTEDNEVFPDFFEQPHWEFTSTPLAIPAVLKPLLGMTKYQVNI